MTRLIDAEKLKKHYAWWEDDERRTLFDQIVDAQPTVDAVPVIRCKDCRFHRGKYCTAWGDGSVAVSCETDADGFCAWAEPKETDND